MTYPPGFDFPVDEGAGESSATETRTAQHCVMVWAVDGYLQELFCMGMALGFAVLGYVFFVCVGGSKSSGSAQKFVREICFMFGNLGERYQEGDTKL